MLYMHLYLQVLFIVGEFALVVFAVSIKPWKGHFAAAAVLGAAFLLLWPLLPESARWLLVQGRKEEAKQVRGHRRGCCVGPTAAGFWEGVGGDGAAAAAACPNLQSQAQVTGCGLTAVCHENLTCAATHQHVLLVHQERHCQRSH
jgi:hypothetical protein